MPSESIAFTTRVEPVSPPWSRRLPDSPYLAPPPLAGEGRVEAGGNWWRRRVPPPGPQRLFRKPFIAIVGCPTEEDIGCRRGKGNRRGAHIAPIRYTLVIPAQAGIQSYKHGRMPWVPACAGMTEEVENTCR